MALPTGPVAPGVPDEDRDRRDPILRASQVLDPGSLEIVAGGRDEGVVVVLGTVEGVRTITYVTDGTSMGGAMGVEGCRLIVEAIDAAVRMRCPVIGVWHSGGARLAEGVTALEGVGGVFAAMIRASGRVPQVSVVVGPAAGGAAYGPALTDVVIMAGDGRVFVTGPDVVRSVTGEDIDAEGLGGVDAHGRRSGVVHVTTPDEATAYARTRAITGMLARPGFMDVNAVAGDVDLRALLPAEAKRAYDVHPVIHALLDDTADGESSFVELQPKWAPNIVVGWGRLGGRAVGIVANNPLRKGGCLDSLSAEKASRFVRTSDSFGVPLVVLVDVPGYLPGVGEEWDGVVRRGAKLLYAFSEAVVPRITVVTRKSFGGAYIAMNSRSLGATAVFAWPEAEVAVMGARAAVGILQRKKLAAVDEPERSELLERLVAEHEAEAGGVHKAIGIGAVDEVVEPHETRDRVARAIAAAPAGCGHHGNMPL